MSYAHGMERRKKKIDEGEMDHFCAICRWANKKKCNTARISNSIRSVRMLRKGQERAREEKRTKRKDRTMNRIKIRMLSFHCFAGSIDRQTMRNSVFVFLTSLNSLLFSFQRIFFFRGGTVNCVCADITTTATTTATKWIWKKKTRTQN